MPTSKQRQDTLTKATRAFLTGDVSVCEQVFTADVVLTSPIMTTASRDELETRLSDRAGGLANVEVSFTSLVDDEGIAVAEWRIEADHVQPFVIPEDTRLDPHGERVALAGVTVAEFKGIRISAVRHYFDKSALVAVLLSN